MESSSLSRPGTLIFIDILFVAYIICIKSTIEKIDTTSEKTTSEKTSESYIELYAPTIDNDLTVFIYCDI